MPEPEGEQRLAPPADAADAADTTADVAHELGNRFAAILAFGHLVRTDPRLPDDLHDQAELLVVEVNRTRRLVDGLLADAAKRAERRAEPRAELPAGADRPAATITGPSPHARVLVVDDEPAIRDYLARILAHLGYEPVVAADGREALAIVGSDRPPDAILCDHRMAGMSGSAFHDAVSAASPRLAQRLAFMSGDVTSAELLAVADARGIALLAKPFDSDAVAATLGRLLGSVTGGDGRG